MSAVIVSARDINREHDLACRSAQSAIEHAIRCGELLMAKKAELRHGEFQPWIEANCEFAYSTAARYMKAAAQSSTGVEISTLSELFTDRKVISSRTSTKDDLSTLLKVPDDRKVPMESGRITLGDIHGVPAMVLFESKYSGFWHDLDMRHGSVSARACRPEMLQYRLANDITLAQVTWFLAPDDGTWRAYENPPTESRK